MNAKNRRSSKRESGMSYFVFGVAVLCGTLAFVTHILKPIGLFDDLKGAACRLGRSLLSDGRFPCEADPQP